MSFRRRVFLWQNFGGSLQHWRLEAKFSASPNPTLFNKLALRLRANKREQKRPKDYLITGPSVWPHYSSSATSSQAETLELNLSGNLGLKHADSSPRRLPLGFALLGCWITSGVPGNELGRSWGSGDSAEFFANQAPRWILLSSSSPPNPRAL